MRVVKKGGGGRGSMTFHSGEVHVCLKNCFTFHLDPHYSLFKDLYHDPLDGLDLISFCMYNLPKCIDLQKPLKNFYSYLNYQLTVHELDI